jgi:hypothetical protein
VLVADDDPLVLRREQEVLRWLRRQVLQRQLRIPAVALNTASVILSRQPPSVTSAPTEPPRLHHALGSIRDHEVGVDLEARPEARARRAGAVRRVEAEAARLELVDRRAVVRARVALGERRSSKSGASPSRGAGAISTTPSPSRSAVSIESASRAGPDPRSLARLRVDRAAALVACPLGGRLGTAHDEPIDDDLDRVALVLVERGRLGEVVLLAIDANADEALLPRRLEDPVALGLAVLDERAEHEEARPSGISSTWSTICWIVWRSIGWPFGQCGIPMRANSRRRWS